MSCAYHQHAFWPKKTGNNFKVTKVCDKKKGPRQEPWGMSRGVSAKDVEPRTETMLCFACIRAGPVKNGGNL